MFFVGDNWESLVVFGFGRMQIGLPQGGKMTENHVEIMARGTVVLFAEAHKTRPELTPRRLANWFYYGKLAKDRERIYLKSFMLGGRRATTLEEIESFFEKTN